MFVGGARLGQRVLGIEERPRLHLPVHLAHAGQTRLHEIDRCDGALTNHPRRLAGPEQMQIRHTHRAPNSTITGAARRPPEGNAPPCYFP